MQIEWLKNDHSAPYGGLKSGFAFEIQAGLVQC